MSNRPFDINDTTPVVEHKMLTDMPGMNPAPLGYGERLEYYAVRDRVDRALQANKIYPAYPQQGESPKAYERRLVHSVMPHGETWAPMATLQKIPEAIYLDSKDKDGKPVDGMRTTILKEAIQAPARRGELVPIKIKDRVGRETTEFVGKMGVWLDQFRAPCMATDVCIDGVPQRF